jgi:hypothetical protein
MVSKWIKFDKHWYGFGGHVVFFDKVVFYFGTREHWGIGVEVSFYDRSLTFDILNLYMGIEVWRSNKGMDDGVEDYVPKSSGDLMD